MQSIVRKLERIAALYLVGVIVSIVASEEVWEYIFGKETNEQ